MKPNLLIFGGGGWGGGVEFRWSQCKLQSYSAPSTLQECLKTKKKTPNPKHPLGTDLHLSKLTDVGAGTDTGQVREQLWPYKAAKLQR